MRITRLRASNHIRDVNITDQPPIPRLASPEISVVDPLLHRPPDTRRRTMSRVRIGHPLHASSIGAAASSFDSSTTGSPPTYSSTLTDIPRSQPEPSPPRTVSAHANSTPSRHQITATQHAKIPRNRTHHTHDHPESTNTDTRQPSPRKRLPNGRPVNDRGVSHPLVQRSVGDPQVGGDLYSGFRRSS